MGGQGQHFMTYKNMLKESLAMGAIISNVLVPSVCPLTQNGFYHVSQTNTANNDWALLANLKLPNFGTSYHFEPVFSSTGTIGTSGASGVTFGMSQGLTAVEDAKDFIDSF